MPKGEKSGGPQHVNEATLRPGEERSREFAAMGGRTGAGGRASALVRTEAKAAAARMNGQAGGRKPKAAAQTPCTCKAGDAAAVEAHAPSCRKAKAYQREGSL